MARLIDITQRVDRRLPVWPGEQAYECRRTADISPACPVNLSVVSFSSHVGTHADAPLHYAADAPDSAACELTPYIGPCQVVDVRNARGQVNVGDFDVAALGKDLRRVLFRTYDRFPGDRWDQSFTAIAAATVSMLAQRGVILIGTDAASLDPQNSKSMDAHRVVLANDMRILEGLVLDDVPAGNYELIALPLPLAGADASPVRAILRPI
ncbi:MAG: arylformamidase [Steroidobacteraceae bacterium]